jgi:hypothetical protein
MRLLTVAPLADGWRLSVDNVQNDMVFTSGRAAEAAARRLALRLSRAGTPTEVRIFLRDSSLGARLVCPLARPDGRPAEAHVAAQDLAALPQAA